jgi:hypothetical protein
MKRKQNLPLHLLTGVAFVVVLIYASCQQAS